MAYCEYCHMNGEHVWGCPNYITPHSNYKCCYCEENIIDGEEYVRNYDNEYIHRDCIPCTEFIIDWLGYRVNKMENCNEGDYNECVEDYDV